MRFQPQTAAWSRCRRAPVQNTSCCGTSTLAQANADRLCTGAVVATETNSPQDGSARAGAGWREVVGATSQVTDEIYVVTANQRSVCIVVQYECMCMHETLKVEQANAKKKELLFVHNYVKCWISDLFIEFNSCFFICFYVFWILMWMIKKQDHFVISINILWLCLPLKVYILYIRVFFLWRLCRACLDSLTARSPFTCFVNCPASCAEWKIRSW